MVSNATRTTETKKIIISGAGPAGLLLAHLLVRRPGYDVHVYDKRPEFQASDQEHTRTFPISLQHRGLTAIRLVPGLESALEQVGKWLVGLCLHSGTKTRNITRPPSLSVERNDIALVLLRELKSVASETSKVTFHFETCSVNVNLKDKTVTTSAATNKETQVSFDYLVAADGAKSTIRKVLSDQGELKYEMKRIPDDYKTFYIRHTSQDESVKLQGDKLHGWMFGSQRILAAPIKSNYCSGVFIFPHGKNPFENLSSKSQVLEYFETQLESRNKKVLSKLVSQQEAKELLERPVSCLWSVKCDRLQIQNKVLLLGDAAHAVSASLGQGCNSALEDVQLFHSMLVSQDDDWTCALHQYNQQRLACAHAVAELSDYASPRTTFMRIEWILRTILRKLLPSFLSSFMRPLPFDLLEKKNLTYTEILDQCQWWISRVKLTESAES